MPIVALLGGNAGAQSLAVTIRGLATDDVPRTETRGILSRQATIGLANGVLIGTAAGVVAALFALTTGAAEAPLSIGIVVGVAALVNLIVATGSGAAIPLVMKKARLDRRAFPLKLSRFWTADHPPIAFNMVLPSSDGESVT